MSNRGSLRSPSSRVIARQSELQSQAGDTDRNPFRRLWFLRVKVVEKHHFRDLV